MKKLTTLLLLTLLFISKDFQAQKSKTTMPRSHKSVALFWDTSLSVQNRDISLELAFLDNYIKDKKDITIHLTKFSNKVISEKTYKIVNSNWEILKQELIHTTYDGATSFLPLVDVKYNDYDTFLLFTDGYQNEAILKSDITKPIIVVSSSERTYFQSLQLKTLSKGSHFIDLYKLSLNQALLELGIAPKEVLVNDSHKKRKTQNIFNKVTGYVSSSDGPLGGVNITVIGKNKGSVTDAKGFYSIAAKKSDKLIFSYLGFRTYKATVQGPTLDIRLLSDEMNLNTVEIKGKTREIRKLDDSDLASDKNKNKGYAVQTLTNKNFSEIETNVSESIRGKVSGFNLAQDKDISMAIIRGYNTIKGNIYPLVVLDGVPLRRSDSTEGQGPGSASKADLSFINPDNVAKIKVLKGLAATNRYGSQGRNGVIEITTKTASYNKEDYKPIDHALLKNNVYKESLSDKLLSNSSYIKTLRKSKSLAEAYATYLKLRDNYGKSTTFYMEVSDYFKQWSAKDLSDRILSNILELNFNNPTGLKVLAFKYEANNNLIKALTIYKRILRLQPKSAQSYKDMATAYATQGYITKAFYLYKSMLENAIKNVDFSGLTNSNTSEFKALIQRKKNVIPKVDISEEYLKTDNVNARLYFEWVNPDMSFEIQFVNPQKRFFSWTHSEDNDAQRIKEEKEQGFTSEEFLLIDAAKGTWLINLTNLDENYPKDQILKLSLYKNYGKPNQTKEIKVINLKKYSQKATLIKIQI
jgi:CarboxypepD_reg-like domain/TonB-dependent Receptor Plug Domain